MSEPALQPGQQARVLVPFIVVTLIWGSTWLVIRDQIGTVPASWSIAYRFAIASVTMFAFALIRRVPLLPARGDIGFLIILGLAQFVLNFNFVYRAEAHVTSGLVAVIFALLLVPNAILSRIFLGQGVSRPFLAGSLVAMLGIALLFTHELQVAPAGPRAVALGIGLTLAGVVSASVANVLQATDRARRLPMATMLAWSMAVGAAANAIWAAASVGAPAFEWRTGYVMGLLYLGVFASAIAFTLYYNVIRTIGAARAAYSSVLVPIIAMGLSTVFEDYRWTASAALGGVLALAGLVVALRARRPAL